MLVNELDLSSGGTGSRAISSCTYITRRFQEKTIHSAEDEVLPVVRVTFLFLEETGQGKVVRTEDGDSSTRVLYAI